MTDTITGQELSKPQTRETQYDNQCIVFYDGEENRYLMKVTEILAFDTDFNGLVFKKVKKIKHTYLEVVQDDRR